MMTTRPPPRQQAVDKGPSKGLDQSPGQESSYLMETPTLDTQMATNEFSLIERGREVSILQPVVLRTKEQSRMRNGRMENISKQRKAIDEYLESLEIMEEEHKHRINPNEAENIEEAYENISDSNRETIQSKCLNFEEANRFSECSSRASVTSTQRKKKRLNIFSSETVTLGRGEILQSLDGQQQLDRLINSNDVRLISEVEWASLLRFDRSFTDVSKERIRRSVIHGLPEGLRGDIWCLICECQLEASYHSPDLYQKLLQIDISGEEYTISKDLKRTLPELKCFNEDYKSGKNRLFNVLKAYACYDNEIGYAQGINYIAAMLLITIEDECQAFWCLIHLLYRKNWRMIYDTKILTRFNTLIQNFNTPKLMSLLDLLRVRMAKQLPEVLQHIENEDLSLAAAFSPIFLTLFVYHIPLPVATRIFELFIVEGEVALLRIIMKLLEHKKEKVMSLFEQQLLTYLRCGIMMECIDELTLDQLLDQ